MGLGMNTILMVAGFGWLQKGHGRHWLGCFLLLFSINGRRFLALSGGAFTGRRALTIECLLMSGCGQSHRELIKESLAQVSTPSHQLPAEVKIKIKEAIESLQKELQNGTQCVITTKLSVQCQVALPSSPAHQSGDDYSIHHVYLRSITLFSIKWAHSRVVELLSYVNYWSFVVRVNVRVWLRSDDFH